MQLYFEPALNRPDLISDPVKEVLQNWKGAVSADEFLVAEINPQFMGGAELCEHYGISNTDGANCVIVEAVRGSNKIFAACLISVDCKRADFNGVVRKFLGARRVSLAPLDEVLRETKMEYGSITVIGLPNSWPILIDPAVVSSERLVMGSGLQRSKLSVPGKALLELPGARILEGLCAVKE